MAESKSEPKATRLGGAPTLAIVLLGLLTATMVWMAAATRHVVFIREKPHAFALELVMLGFVTSLPMIVFYWTRNLPMKQCILVILLLSVKLAILHVLLELSGFYKAMM